MIVDKRNLQLNAGYVAVHAAVLACCALLWVRCTLDRRAQNALALVSSAFAISVAWRLRLLPVPSCCIFDLLFDPVFCKRMFTY